MWVHELYNSGWFWYISYLCLFIYLCIIPVFCIIIEGTIDVTEKKRILTNKGNLQKAKMAISNVKRYNKIDAVISLKMAKMDFQRFLIVKYLGRKLRFLLFFHKKGNPLILKNLKTKLRTFLWFPNQNLWQIGPGIYELWSNLNKQTKRDYYFIYIDMMVKDQQHFSTLDLVEDPQGMDSRLRMKRWWYIFTISSSVEQEDDIKAILKCICVVTKQIAWILTY